MLSRQRGFLLNPYRFAGGPGPEPGDDPYFSDVSLLLHMDGANGGTSFPDSSSYARTVQAMSTANSTTAQQKFGPSSLQVDGSGYLSVADAAGTNFGSQPFTAEWWARPTQWNGDAGMAGRRIGAVYCPWEIRLSSVGVTTLISNSTVDGWSHIASFSGTSVPLNTWTHFAFVGDGSFLRMFVGGFMSSTVLTYSSIATDSAPFFVGKGGDSGFMGQIDELRITPGVARYTANFSPPAAPFPDQA